MALLSRRWTVQCRVVLVHNHVHGLEGLVLLLHQASREVLPLWIQRAKLLNYGLREFRLVWILSHPFLIMSHDIDHSLLNLLVFIVLEGLHHPFVFFRHRDMGLMLAWSLDECINGCRWYLL